VAPAGVVIARVIDVVLVVTVMPPASWTVTTGWEAKATLCVVLADGEVVKASLAAEPTVMVKLVLTALVRPLEAAVSVSFPVLRLMLHPVNGGDTRDRVCGVGRASQRSSCGSLTRSGTARGPAAFPRSRGEHARTRNWSLSPGKVFEPRARAHNGAS
jgi:hypothetical protein